MSLENIGDGFEVLFGDLPCFFDAKILSILAAGVSEMTNKHLSTISKCISTMKLRKFELVLTNSLLIDDEGLKELSHAISECRHLKSLILAFDGCSMIGDRELSRIC